MSTDSRDHSGAPERDVQGTDAGGKPIALVDMAEPPRHGLDGAGPEDEPTILLEGGAAKPVPLDAPPILLRDLSQVSESASLSAIAEDPPASAFGPAEGERSSATMSLELDLTGEVDIAAAVAAIEVRDLPASSSFSAPSDGSDFDDDDLSTPLGQLASMVDVAPPLELASLRAPLPEEHDDATTSTSDAAPIVLTSARPPAEASTPPRQPLIADDDVPLLLLGPEPPRGSAPGEEPSVEPAVPPPPPSAEARLVAVGTETELSIASDDGADLLSGDGPSPASHSTIPPDPPQPPTSPESGDALAPPGAPLPDGFLADETGAVTVPASVRRSLAATARSGTRGSPRRGRSPLASYMSASLPRMMPGMGPMTPTVSRDRADARSLETGTLSGFDPGDEGSEEEAPVLMLGKERADSDPMRLLAHRSILVALLPGPSAGAGGKLAIQLARNCPALVRLLPLEASGSSTSGQILTWLRTAGVEYEILSGGWEAIPNIVGVHDYAVWDGPRERAALGRFLQHVSAPLVVPAPGGGLGQGGGHFTYLFDDSDRGASALRSALRCVGHQIDQLEVLVASGALASRARRQVRMMCGPLQVPISFGRAPEDPAALAERSEARSGERWLILPPSYRGGDRQRHLAVLLEQGEAGLWLGRYS